MPKTADAAEKLCVRRGLRLTLPRRRVLRIISASRQPIGAYDIVRKMGAQPPTVYRALDFLLNAGLIHKIQNGAAFVACAHPRLDHSCFLLVCTSCGKCTEQCTGQAEKVLRRAALTAGFLAHQLTMEVAGVCRRCRRASAAG